MMCLEDHGLRQLYHWGDLHNGDVGAWVGAGAYGKSLYFPLNFAMKPKLL